MKIDEANKVIKSTSEFDRKSQESSRTELFAKYVEIEIF